MRLIDADVLVQKIGWLPLTEENVAWTKAIDAAPTVSCDTCMHHHYCHQTVGYGYDDHKSWREVSGCSRYWEVPQPRQEET